MPIGNNTLTPAPRRGRRRGRGPRGGRRRVPVYPLGKFCRFYLIVLVVTVLIKTVFMQAPLEPGVKFLGFLVTHLAGGLAMDRYVLHRVVWHSNHNTVAEIAKLKSMLLVFWQFTYPWFFLQLAAVRYL